MIKFSIPKVKNQEIKSTLLTKKGIQLFIKREDVIHPYISGNKYRKLKYNLIEAESKGFKTLLSFGGAFSNHIAAVAAAGKVYGFNTIGVIRGEELETQINNNDTLRYANSCGMQLKFISRSSYRLKHTDEFKKALIREFDNFYMIPEGGTNSLAVKGCEEILTPSDKDFDVVCSSVGTGGTLSGLINCSKLGQQVLGFQALKGDFLQDDIRKFVKNDHWKLIDDYHFGGYAKVNTELINFINDFKDKNDVPLDPVYTGKMIFGIIDLVKKGYFKEGTRILAIHTGGLQGILGMNRKLEKQKLPLIAI